MAEARLYFEPFRKQKGLMLKRTIKFMMRMLILLGVADNVLGFVRVNFLAVESKMEEIDRTYGAITEGGRSFDKQYAVEMANIVIRKEKRESDERAQRKSREKQAKLTEKREALKTMKEDLEGTLEMARKDRENLKKQMFKSEAVSEEEMELLIKKFQEQLEKTLDLLNKEDEELYEHMERERELNKNKPTAQ